MTAAQRLCVNCKHYQRAWLGEKDCNGVIDPITGGAGSWTHIERDYSKYSTKCGREGVLWEPRRSALGYLLDFILRREAT